MRARALRKLSLPISAMLLAGMLGSSYAQNPFEDPAAPAAGEAASPFEPTFGEPTAPAAPDPFAAADAQQQEPPAPAFDPFAANEPQQPAAPASANPFGTGDVVTEGTGLDPFAQTAPEVPDPFAEPGDPPGVPEGMDPFGVTDPPQPIVAADPFAPAQGATDSPFGQVSPFGAATQPQESAQAPPAASPFGFDAAQAAEAVTEEEAGERGISRLYEFRYLHVERVDGSRMAVRRAMTQEEAEAFDNQIMNYYTKAAAEGRLPNYQPGLYDLDEWAQWMLYAYQVDLWKQYCMETVLTGTEFDESQAAIDWPGDPQIDPQAPQLVGAAIGGGGGKDGGGGGFGPAQAFAPGQQALPGQTSGRTRTQFTPLADTRGQQQPGIQQQPQFGPEFGGEFGGGGGFGQQGAAGGPTVHDPAQMNEQTAAVYEQFFETVREFEREQAAFMQELQLFLLERESRREEYADWRDSQILLVKDWVNEWGRRYDGQVTTIAGVRYELYRPESVPTQTVRGANIVVTDFDLTPYDLLNPDGTVRGPAQQ